MLRSALVLLFCWPLLAPAAGASEEESAPKMPDVRPPIGVVGGTVFSKGTVTFEYRFERQTQDGLMVGDQTVPSVALTNAYVIVPIGQTNDTHIVELTWTPFDDVTFLFTLPYHIKRMEQFYRDAGRFTRFANESDGLGDLGVQLLYRIFEDGRSRTHFTLGLTLPTGSINQTGLTPASTDELTRLPYSMQLGSGTLDIQVGFTYNGHWRGNYWGTHLLGTLHSDTNDNDYKLGNSYSVTAWAGRRWLSWLTTSFRLDWRQWFDPNGRDRLLDPSLSPANDPSKQAGRRLDALFGLDFHLSEGRPAGTRLSLEAGLPAYQNLDGPQLRTQWLVNAGFRHVF